LNEHTRDICNEGLSNSIELPEALHHDSVLCSHTFDIDLDGENELLIGTFGCKLLIFKQGKGTLAMMIVLVVISDSYGRGTFRLLQID
jgi:hypothetical protein